MPSRPRPVASSDLVGQPRQGIEDLGQPGLIAAAGGGQRQPGGGALDADPAALLEPGALEGSNVSPVGALVEMIQSSRNFESHMKLLQTAESDEKSAAQLLSMG